MVPVSSPVSSCEAVASRSDSEATSKSDAEVEELHPAVAGDHHVVRLEIAMCDARGVSSRETIGNLRRDVEALAQRRRQPA